MLLSFNYIMLLIVNQNISVFKEENEKLFNKANELIGENTILKQKVSIFKLSFYYYCIYKIVYIVLG